MKRYVQVALALFALLGICCRLGPPLPPSGVPIVKVYHIESGFTDAQINALRTAFDDIWARYSLGYVQGDIRQDLNLADPVDTAEKCMEGCIMFEQSSSLSVRAMDQMKRGQILGWVTGPVMYLVEDRLTDPDDFYEVAAHEFGHTFGMDHVPDESAVMFRYHSNPGARCPTKADMQEFCYHLGCELDEVSWCN